MKLVHEVKMEVDSRDEARHTEKSDLTLMCRHVTVALQALGLLLLANHTQQFNQTINQYTNEINEET